jgi:C4-type Zn-finger protein
MSQQIFYFGNQRMKFAPCPECKNTVQWWQETDVMTDGYWNFDEATAWNSVCSNCRYHYVDLHGDGYITNYPIKDSHE